MKRMLKTLLVLTASAVLWAGQANAVLISLDVTVVGTDVTLDVNISDLGTSVIAAADLDIAFDDGVLTLVSAFTGNELGYLDGFALAGAAEWVPGIIDIWIVSLLSDAELWALQGGSDFTLFSIVFTFDGETEFGDFAFIWDEFNDVKCEENRVCAGVPEPGTLGLLGLGLLGLGLARRRRML